MKLLIENPVDEVIEKLRIRRAFLETDLCGLVIKNVVNISPDSLGIRVIFRTHINTLEEITFINSDFYNLKLFIN